MPIEEEVFENRTEMLAYSNALGRSPVAEVRVIGERVDYCVVPEHRTVYTRYVLLIEDDDLLVDVLADEICPQTVEEKWVTAGAVTDHAYSDYVLPREDSDE